MIVDTHIHLYDPFREGGAPWPEPDDEIYLTTRADRWLERAIPSGVDGAIVVECSEWVEDNQWVLDLADDEPRLLGLVGNLDGNPPAATGLRAKSRQAILVVFLQLAFSRLQQAPYNLTQSPVPKETALSLQSLFPYQRLPTAVHSSALLSFWQFPLSGGPTVGCVQQAPLALQSSVPTLAFLAGNMPL